MSSNSTDQVFQKGKVINTCKEFLLKGDQLLAYKLQDEEYFNHYDKNRKNTKVIRNDLPVAKTIQNDEYQELLMKHQMLEQLEKEDAMLALEIQKQLIKEETNEMIIQQKIDQEIAKKLQAKEILNESELVDSTQALTANLASNLHIKDKTDVKEEEDDEDLKLARKLQHEENAKLKRKKKIESEDERLAREIYEQEKLLVKNQNRPRLEIKHSSKSSSLTSLSSSESFLTTTTMPVELKHSNVSEKYSTTANEYEQNLLIDDLCESSSIMKQTNEIAKSQENLAMTDSKIDDSCESLKTNNIVEFIDPTFKKRIKPQSNLDSESNQKGIDKEVLYDLKSESSNYFDSTLDDTEMFLPVQGQKRLNGSIKLVKKNKKSQCLQQ